MTPSQPITGFAAVGFTLLIALFLAGVFVCVSVFLGPKKPTAAKELPYESGMTPVGTTQQQFGVHYYVVAMLYILFDIDIIFMYPWGILLKRELGVFGLAEMGVFAGILAIGYIYMLKKGALEWD